MNCSVNTSNRMKFPVKMKKKSKKNLKTGSDDDDYYHPVACDTCKTEVAMYDKDEIYHFFNVVASHT